jgi:hypothetical protein
VSGRARTPRFWITAAAVVALMAVTDLVITPAWDAAPAGVRTSILWAAGVAVAALLIWLIRATLRD